MSFSSRLIVSACVGTYGLATTKVLNGSTAALQEVANPDHFSDDKLRVAVAGRAAAEFELRMYMKKASIERRQLIESLQKSTQKSDHHERAMTLSRYHDFNHKLKLNAEKMMYPGQNIGLRQNYLNHFGCTAWTEDALSKIKEVSRNGVVELGAGSGKWANALRLRGVDVRAFDDMSFLPESTIDDKIQSETAQLASRAGVEVGNEKVFKSKQLNGRTYLGFKKGNNLNNRSLLLVYPPSGDMAVKVLREYEGKTLIYVGEGRGGVNANVDFFDVLENRIKFKLRKDDRDRGEWRLVHMDELAPFAGGHEKMYIFTRKG